MLAPPKHAEDLNVLFVSGAERASDGSRVVRCDYGARQIVLSGGVANVAYVGDVAAIPAGVNVVVLARCGFTHDAVRVVRAARARRALVCADHDDRIFTPWDVAGMGGLRTRALRDRDLAVETRASLRQHEVLRLLPAMDATIVSTPGLADELTGLGLRTAVMRNTLDTARHAPIARPRHSLRRLLFMTGTQTHDADLRVMEPDVSAFLRRHSDVSLTLLGPVAPPPQLAALPNVQLQKKLPLDQLYAFVSSFDACLVPLENTVFNDCKSAIKFLECGLVSVPVIASPRREFRELIEHDENGILVTEQQGFGVALARLHQSPELLSRIALGAYETVLREHTVESRGDALANLLLRLSSERQFHSPRPLPHLPALGSQLP
jgi:hypothetical protein